MNQYDRARFGRLAPGLGANVNLVTNATVLRINTTESANAVESVEFAAIDGRRWSFPVRRPSSVPVASRTRASCSPPTTRPRTASGMTKTLSAAT